MLLSNEILYIIYFILCFLGTQGKPSLINLPSTIRDLGIGGKTNQFKLYSGKRMKNDSLLMVYFHDQTVAIVEMEQNKLLLSCELIEVPGHEDVIKSLGELENVSRPVGITFKEMRKLMKQCQEIERRIQLQDKNSTPHAIVARGVFGKNPFSLLSGIIPGTKWCGTGDIAQDYYDLGAEANVDRCCRAHDLCPIKIKGLSERYNLTNDAIYTKSHCKCDDDLFNCLKNNLTPTGNVLGNIYFNLVQVPCIDEDLEKGLIFRNARSEF